MAPKPDPSLINEDLAPVPASQRTWGVWNMTALWIGMVVCVPTYMLAGGLIDLGMNWWQAVLTVGLGNLIVLFPMILTGHAGAKYGVPFPVLARASFGVLGANIPAILRGLVACGWFGIQTWIGGSAIYRLSNALAGRDLGGADLPVLGINGAEVAGLLIFWALQLVIIWRGIDSKSAASCSSTTISCERPNSTPTISIGEAGPIGTAEVPTRSLSWRSWPEFCRIFRASCRRPDGSILWHHSGATSTPMPGSLGFSSRGASTGSSHGDCNEHI